MRWEDRLFMLTFSSLVVLGAGGTAVADIVHLKNGRSLTVRSWQYERDQLVFETEAGEMAIPRSLVKRIDAVPSPFLSAPEDPSPGESVSRTPSPAVIPQTSLSEFPFQAPPARRSEAIRESIGGLKHSLRTRPENEAAISREIAVNLSLLASRSLEQNDALGAERLFREALGYDAQLSVAQVGLAASYLVQGKLDYAKGEIMSALVGAPHDPALHLLLGEVHYREENLFAAIKEWEISLAQDDDPRVRGRLEKARREFSVDRGYRRTDSAHFTIRHLGEAQVQNSFKSSILNILEVQYELLSSRFRYEPPGPVVVLLHPSNDFYEATRAPQLVGGLFDGKIRVPIGGLGRLTPQAEAVLMHELTHAFVFFLSGGRCPRWLQEGLAQMMEEKALRPSERQRLAREFAASAGGLWHSEFSYPSALSFTRYLSERFDFEALLETLGRIGRGRSAEEALEETTRESLPDLQEAWGNWLLQTQPGRP